MIYQLILLWGDFISYGQEKKKMKGVFEALIIEIRHHQGLKSPKHLIN